MLGENDTIAALATPRGTAALSVLRISGQATSKILGNCFASKENLQSHKVHYGFWKEPFENGRFLDEVTVLYFGPGRGFTGEESAEIICHGGPVVTEMILKSILEAGARVARAGRVQLPCGDE